MDEQRSEQSDAAAPPTPHSRQQLLTGVALVTLGLAILTRIFWLEFQNSDSVGLHWVLLFWLTGPLIGIGTFYPSRRTLLGVIFAIELQIIFVLIGLAIAFRLG